MVFHAFAIEPRGEHSHLPVDVILPEHLVLVVVSGDGDRPSEILAEPQPSGAAADVFVFRPPDRGEDHMVAAVGLPFLRVQEDRRGGKIDAHGQGRRAEDDFDFPFSGVFLDDAAFIPRQVCMMEGDRFPQAGCEFFL